MLIFTQHLQALGFKIAVQTRHIKTNRTRKNKETGQTIAFGEESGTRIRVLSDK